MYLTTNIITHYYPVDFFNIKFVLFLSNIFSDLIIFYRNLRFIHLIYLTIIIITYYDSVEFLILNFALDVIKLKYTIRNINFSKLVRTNKLFQNQFYQKYFMQKMVSFTKLRFNTNFRRLQGMCSKIKEILIVSRKLGSYFLSNFHADIHHCHLQHTEISEPSHLCTEFKIHLITSDLRKTMCI